MGSLIQAHGIVAKWVVKFVLICSLPKQSIRRNICHGRAAKTNPLRLGGDPETVELGAEFSFCVENCSPLIKMCLGYATFVPTKAFQAVTFVTVTKFGVLQMDQGIPIQNQSL